MILEKWNWFPIHNWSMCNFQFQLGTEGGRFWLGWQVFTTHHWMVRIYKLKSPKNRLRGKLKRKTKPVSALFSATTQNMFISLIWTLILSVKTEEGLHGCLLHISPVVWSWEQSDCFTTFFSLSLLPPNNQHFSVPVVSNLTFFFFFGAECEESEVKFSSKANKDKEEELLELAQTFSLMTTRWI